MLGITCTVCIHLPLQKSMDSAARQVCTHTRPRFLFTSANLWCELYCHFKNEKHGRRGQATCLTLNGLAPSRDRKKHAGAWGQLSHTGTFSPPPSGLADAQPTHGCSIQSPLTSLAAAYHTVATWALRNASCPGSWEYMDLLNLISATLTTSTFFCSVCQRGGARRGIGSGWGRRLRVREMSWPEEGADPSNTAWSWVGALLLGHTPG